jgi:hypothetical protein
MNFNPEAVASWQGNSKTMPKRRFRRRVSLCRTLPGARSRRRPTAQPRLARGVRWTEVDRAHRLLEWRYMPHDLPTQGRPSINKRSDGYTRECSRRWSTICAYCCAFRRAERPIRRQPYWTPAPCNPPRTERLSGRLRRGEAQEGYEGTRGGGHTGTPARLACDSSQRAGARARGQVGRDCARGHGRVGGTGIRGARIYRREASYGSGDSWHEVGSG